MLAPFSNQRYVVASVLTHAIHRGVGGEDILTTLGSSRARSTTRNDAGLSAQASIELDSLAGLGTKLKNAVWIWMKYPPRRVKGFSTASNPSSVFCKEAAAAAAVDDVPAELLIGDDTKRCEEEVPAAVSASHRLAGAKAGTQGVIV
jgi:hypothetical protein